MARQFDLWFGGIFLAVGGICLVVAAVLALALIYLPGAPQGAWVGLAAPALVGCAFGILGGVFVARGLRRRRIAQHLREVGTIANAAVVAVERTGARLNRRRLWRVRYVYDDLSGIRHHGDSGYLSADEAHSYAAGDTVLVRFDPADPTVNAWVGREGAQQ